MSETRNELSYGTEQTENASTDAQSVTAAVGQADGWNVGSMKMKDVGNRPVAVVRTESGFHAVDNACPHQGYGLTTGALDGELLTCQWHNWKFDVRTGHCVIGEEDVPCHPVEIVDGEVHVTVNSPSNSEQQERLWPSLRRGIDAHYVGQIARDSVRLLETGAPPADIMWTGVEASASRTQWGIGHELAMAADCLALAEIQHGTERALPLVQGLAGMAETTRGRPERKVPAPDTTVSVLDAIEGEDADGTMAGLLGAIETGVEPATIRHHLISAASAHHLGYGHGMIYTQKTFEILDRVGWDRAPDILPHLGASLVWSTREDTLPYMAKAMKALANVDLNGLAATTKQDGWAPGGLVDTFLSATAAPIEEAVTAAHNGAGVEGLIDAVTLGASDRLLRHDLQVELDRAEPFGWLDITHALTLGQAVRWAWRNDPGPDTARAALFAVWLLFDAGRSERRNGHTADPTMLPGGFEQPTVADLGQALTFGDPASAVALAFSGDRDIVGATLAEAALADGAGSFIVAAHLVKTTEAARREAVELDSSLPLAATARFLAAPRLERFVTANIMESVDFVTTGKPPRR